MTPWPKPSQRAAEYVRKVKACGHWTHVDTKRDGAVLRHDTTGVTVVYSLHDGGNDLNGAHNFATAAQNACGCRFIESRNRKPSRKQWRGAKYSPHLDALDRAVMGERAAAQEDYENASARLAAIRAEDPNLRQHRREAERIAADLLFLSNELQRLGAPVPGQRWT